ncbi:MAG: hypothetical protein H6835_12060 [Planctomycetes bacterium]|nr:hypothetical protein [Planctomycetota bacterium]
MRYLTLIASALLFAVPAKADKFWLTDPEAEQQNAAEGSSPNVIEGVLIAESDEGYHVRVVGGEILLPKKSVFKIEKDALALDAIVKAEADAKAQGERDNQERRLAQEVAVTEQNVRIAEAAARRTARAVDADARLAEADAVQVQGAAAFDPVVGVAASGNQYELMRDAQVAWTLTNDRRYLKLLRQLRRMR